MRFQKRSNQRETHSRQKRTNFAVQSCLHNNPLSQFTCHVYLIYRDASSMAPQCIPPQFWSSIKRRHLQCHHQTGTSNGQESSWREFLSQNSSSRALGGRRDGAGGTSCSGAGGCSASGGGSGNAGSGRRDLYAGAGANVLGVLDGCLLIGLGAGLRNAAGELRDPILRSANALNAEAATAGAAQAGANAAFSAVREVAQAGGSGAGSSGSGCCIGSHKAGREECKGDGVAHCDD